MRWLIGVCLVWLVASSFINLMNPRGNVISAMFYASVTVLGLLVLAGLIFGWGI